ncbi:acidic phospholipase A2 PLA-2-like [Mytilus edulis]|uniref:acidic phospholipase A2 PLA-2-like n=1 Tax=Mytilus edulis TaxID=6550 RepID=UPI0039EFD0D3
MYLYKKHFIILIVCFLFNNYGFAVKHRTKRNLLAMSDMISFTTGRYGLDFNKYGHFCGKGGKGQIMDSIDWCCNLHDNCYGRLQKYGCSHLLMSTYDWTLVHYQIVCPYVTTLKTRSVFKIPKSTSYEKIEVDKDYCHQATCECDKNLAYCLGHNNIYYNKELQSKSKLLRFIHNAAHFLTKGRI